MTTPNLDRALARLAHKQEGTFNLDQARRIGFTDRAVEYRVNAGTYDRLDAEVFVLPGYPGTLVRQCWAAVLGSPGAGVGGLAAAKVLELPGIGAGRPEIVLPPDANSRSDLAIVHRFDSPRFTIVKGLKTTSIAQTIFDITPRVSVERLERVVDDSVLTNRMTIEDLDERLSFYEGSRRAGLPVMRALINDRRADGWMPPESELERLADRIMRRLSGTPSVKAQVRFEWLERGRGRVDRLVDDLVLVELDGRRWHARLFDFDRDHWRDSLAVANGLLPLRFTYLHVTTRPGEVIQLIEQTRRLARRTAEAA